MRLFASVVTFGLLFSISAFATMLSFTNKKAGSCLDLDERIGASPADQTPLVWQIPRKNATKITVGVPSYAYKANSHQIWTALSEEEVELRFIWWGSAWTLCVDLETDANIKIRNDSEQCQKLESHAGWPKAYALQHPNHYHWSGLNVTNSQVNILSNLTGIVVNATSSWWAPGNMTFDMTLAWWG